MSWWQHSVNTWSAGGPLLIPLAVLCLGILGYTLRSSQAVRQIAQQADLLLRTLEGQGDDSPASLLSRQKSWLSQAYLRALDDVKAGGKPLATLEQVEIGCSEALRKDWLILAALTASAPLLGLLGTVMGMIQTFDAVSAVSGETGQRVAAGISRALLTTQFGLVIALPGVFGAAHLRRGVREVEARLAACRFLLAEGL
ncbi:MAG: MotA/TolQ/ExbB proton channel family protein [Kiritimatiellia bacterium]